jgi:hypothetical protein
MRFAGVRSKKNGEVTIIEKAELEAGPPLSKEEKNWRGRELVSWKGDRLWSLLVLGTRQGWEVWTFQWYNRAITCDWVFLSCCLENSLCYKVEL